ncbi:MAG: hypothetical protein KME50_04070 [Nostoc desertorum CM1-VF14]|jgi:hypothetical protein|nr:hypothetical protein [Nostoc desertorum CM1-VF14]
MRIDIFEQMTVNNGLILTLFILIITLLALGYGFGVKARRLPFTAEIGFSDKQWQFLRWWVKLALVAGVLLPICLLALAWKQPSSWVFWGSYLLIVAVQLISERVFSRSLVPSIVLPIGFFYTAFRLWQLLDGFTQLKFSYLTLAGYGVVVLFWVANLIMLMVMAIPTIFKGSESISQS